MRFIGKQNDRMTELKFLYSAVDALSNKENITVTDFLALRAFISSEKMELELYQTDAEESGRELSKDEEAYLDLLRRMAADLAYTGAGIEDAVYSAQSSASWAFYHWGLDKE